MKSSVQISLYSKQHVVFLKYIVKRTVLPNNIALEYVPLTNQNLATRVNSMLKETAGSVDRV